MPYLIPLKLILSIPFRYTFHLDAGLHPPPAYRHYKSSSIPDIPDFSDAFLHHLFRCIVLHLFRFISSIKRKMKMVGTWWTWTWDGFEHEHAWHERTWTKMKDGTWTWIPFCWYGTVAHPHCIYICVVKVYQCVGDCADMLRPRGKCCCGCWRSIVAHNVLFVCFLGALIWHVHPSKTPKQTLRRRRCGGIFGIGTALARWLHRFW